MEDQICSPEKCSMKNSYNKNIFYLNEKNIYIIKMFLIEYKFTLTKWKCILIHEKRGYNQNIFYWIQTCFNWIKIYFEIIKKGDMMKIYFIKYKVIWLNENIFAYHMNFYFCKISATIINCLTYMEAANINALFCYLMTIFLISFCLALFRCNFHFLIKADFLF